LLNVALFEHGLVMTASAIGDNLVQRDFLNTLAKMNRNFLVQRGLSPREMLHSSKNLSEYTPVICYSTKTALFGLLSEKEGPKMVMILPIQVF
jgi:hypothetical protein